MNKTIAKEYFLNLILFNIFLYLLFILNWTENDKKGKNSNKITLPDPSSIS